MMKKCIKMCEKMSIQEKLDCLTAMMPKCFNMVLSELDEPAKNKVASEVLNKMQEIAAKYKTPLN